MANIVGIFNVLKWSPSTCTHSHSLRKTTFNRGVHTPGHGPKSLTCLMLWPSLLSSFLSARPLCPTLTEEYTHIHTQPSLTFVTVPKYALFLFASGPLHIFFPQDVPSWLTYILSQLKHYFRREASVMPRFEQALLSICFQSILYSLMKAFTIPSCVRLLM